MEPRTDGYVVVPGASDVAGASVWWELAGLVDVGRLALEWTARGLVADELPTLPGPEAALRRALREQAGRRRLVRPLEERAAWALVDEAASGELLAHSVELRVRLGVLGPEFDPANHHLRAAVEDDFRSAL